MTTVSEKIDSKLVKELREKSGAPMGDCLNRPDRGFGLTGLRPDRAFGPAGWLGLDRIAVPRAAAWAPRRQAWRIFATGDFSDQPETALPRQASRLASSR